jgi:hypothetical protein
LIIFSTFCFPFLILTFLAHQDDFMFRYDATASQINSLASVSNLVRQEVYINCTNTVAYYDSRTQLYDKAVNLRGFNDDIINPGGRRKRKGNFKYSVSETEDGCMVCKLFSPSISSHF